MKKILIILMLALFAGSAWAQNIVSTTPSNRNVILEEFTGIQCVWCPHGHLIANQLVADNPGRAWSINIHQGSYASSTPDYRTPFGDALASENSVTGYPIGMVNRTGNAVGRGDWNNLASQVLSQASPVNVAAKATIDMNTRLLTVDVEAYYTSNGPSNENFIHVALLQNNILGYQSGAYYLNPSQMEGNTYKHMHMLRHLLTGQWGDTIKDTKQGSLFQKQYTFTVPANLNNVSYVLENLDVVVFVSENHKNIITGNKAEMIYENTEPINYSLKENTILGCDEVEMYVYMQNLSQEAITSIDFAYTLNGNNETYQWTGNIAKDESKDITLPVIAIVSGQDMPVALNVTAINGAPYSGADKTITLKKTNYTVNKNTQIEVKTSDYATANWLYLYNSNGTRVFSKDFSTDRTVYTFDLPSLDEGCYVLEVADIYGYGLSKNVAGYLKVLDAAGKVIYNLNGSFGFRAYLYLNSNGIVGVEDVSTTNTELSVYPNPASDRLHVVSSEPFSRYILSNMLGQEVMNTEVHQNEVDITVSHLNKGLYLLKIETEKGSVVKKVVVE
jgi:hypothetical protein